jgi:UDPglucose--hexose-1-phosphate uridylyltransferase
MQINAQTIKNLIQIEQTFPAYFVGSNADLPIVGGSMLAHEHYQGGRHIFPMMKATIKTPLTFTGFEHVTAGVVNWPMTDIRLVSADTDQLVALSDKIMTAWKQYSDPSVSVVATTGDMSHHTVTPIMHREKETYVLDLVLRDNNTSAQYPNGIFHPHDEVAHIKKENIGLIEVMGRAILPARLKTEMQEVKKYWLGDANEIAAYHQPWADQIKTQQAITATNVDDVMEQALADVFAQVLENAGVFKNDDKGQEALAKFVQTI